MLHNVCDPQADLCRHMHLLSVPDMQAARSLMQVRVAVFKIHECMQP